MKKLKRVPHLGKLLSTAALAASSLLSAAEERPNILMIVLDDLNDFVGVMNGHPQAHTPNIDRLAERGILFTNAHSNTPVCLPVRASFIRGVHPISTGPASGRPERGRKFNYASI